MLALSSLSNHNFRPVVILFGSLLAMFFCFPGFGQQQSAASTDTAAELKSRAEAGDQVARNKLAQLLISADAASPGYDLAISWLRNTASQNKPDAQFLLGYFYEHGKGLPCDYTKAAESYRAAALQGYAAAENNLGALYQHGNGVPQDIALAFKWYSAGAQHGNPAAQHNLGTFYYLGYATRIDYAQATKWFRASANQGFAPGQNALAYSYLKGLGVPRDYAEAAHWGRLAAAQGHPRAEALLGYLYEHGEGLPVDYVAAYTWYSSAVAAGDDTSADRLKSLSQIMTRNQIDKANSLVVQQSPRPYSIPVASSLFPNP
jgi:uncharacterized protein